LQLSFSLFSKREKNFFFFLRYFLPFLPSGLSPPLSPEEALGPPLDVFPFFREVGRLFDEFSVGETCYALFSLLF